MKCERCWGSGKKLNHHELGQLAHLARIHRRESIRDAAHRLGISESMLSLLERGKRSWTRELYYKAVKDSLT